MSILVGGSLLLIIAQSGLIAACAAVASFALYECFKDNETVKSVNNELDKAVESTINFIASSVEKLIPTKPLGATA